MNTKLNSKYKVGDKVRIVKERTIGMNDYGKMDKYLDTVMTIVDIRYMAGDRYIMAEDDGRWNWYDDMIVGLTDDRELMKFDIIQKPEHYNKGEIEVIDAIEDWGLDNDFYLANVIKYVSRCMHKGDMEQDILKAIWYLNRWVERRVDHE